MSAGKQAGKQADQQTGDTIIKQHTCGVKDAGKQAGRQTEVTMAVNMEIASDHYVTPYNLLATPGVLGMQGAQALQPLHACLSAPFLLTRQPAEC
jgi:hypothetical protein